MRVDVQSLGTFTRLAHEGAEAATESLTQLTGIEATVEVTRISLVDRRDVGVELAGGSAGAAGRSVGVQFGFEGALAGEAALAFEREGSEEIVEALLGGTADESMARSSVEEVGNIMMSGFIDGWAEYLGTPIDQTPPTYVERLGGDVLPDGPAGDGDQVFVFRSGIRCRGRDVEFSIYMLPEHGSLAGLLADRADGDAIPVEKLAALNRMTRSGAQLAAENLEVMSGIDTELEAAQLSFVPVEDIPKGLDDDPYVGTVVEFTGTPSGFVLVLFDERSAVTVAEELTPVESEGDGLTARHEAAIEELGNVVTSGFVDGWANVLERSIDHTPPRLVHDLGPAIVDPLAARLGQSQRHAFVLDSRMRTDDLAFESEVYALPDERELHAALDELDVDRADRTTADPEALF